MDTVQQEFGWKAITGQLDIDADWNSYVESMMAAGLDKLVVSVAKQRVQLLHCLPSVESRQISSSTNLLGRPRPLRVVVFLSGMYVIYHTNISVPFKEKI